MNRQHLLPGAKTNDIVKITGDICGLHATGAKEPYLALLARTVNFTRKNLDEELYQNKTLGKIRCMRGTLYILGREMMPLAFKATQTQVEKISSRYAEFRGITADVYREYSGRIVEMLNSETLNLSQIKDGLRSPPLNLGVLLNLMCDRGLLVRLQNSWKAPNYRYAILRNYFPGLNLHKYSETEAIKKLIEHYFYSFGPAAVDDIAWWIGTTKAIVKSTLKKLGNNIAPVTINGLAGDYFALSSDINTIQNQDIQVKPVVNLLPYLDSYLMGYKNRERYLDYRYYHNAYDRSGNATSLILINGQVKGVWDYSEAEQALKFYLFEAQNKTIMQEIEKSAQSIGNFFNGKQTVVRFVSKMTFLNQRKPGAMMSPLKDLG